MAGMGNEETKNVTGLVSPAGYLPPPGELHLTQTLRLWAPWELSRWTRADGGV